MHLIADVLYPYHLSVSKLDLLRKKCHKTTVHTPAHMFTFCMNENLVDYRCNINDTIHNVHDSTYNKKRCENVERIFYSWDAFHNIRHSPCFTNAST